MRHTATASEALAEAGAKAEDLPELALVNNLHLEDRVEAESLLKVAAGGVQP